MDQSNIIESTVRVWRSRTYGARLGYETHYVGWPFYIHASSTPALKERYTRISWPLFRPRRPADPQPLLRVPADPAALPRTRSISRPAATSGIPWPFWTMERDAKDRRAPLASPDADLRAADDATMEEVFYFWPFFRRHTGPRRQLRLNASDVLFLSIATRSEGETRRAATSARSFRCGLS